MKNKIHSTAEKTQKRHLHSHHLLFVFISIFFISSCVSKKKYQALDSKFKTMQNEDNTCNDALKTAQNSIANLNIQKADLQAQIDYLKKNSNRVLGALQDMSVLSEKQAESVKQSLESINKKDTYIMSLQSAIARKDSLNMILVTNLKSSLSDVNDKDVTIKVEKGVVYIDISDKVLFNTAQFVVTKSALNVLGKIAKVVNAHSDIDFIVEGHTDNVPIHTPCLEDNWDLSVKRATSVVRILEHEYKINPARMTASGHSYFVPVASNETVDGKAQNRRTRIIILPQLDQFFKLMIKK
jgi:chemotaxis protein MotB